jgi:hypothetical protein
MARQIWLGLLALFAAVTMASMPAAALGNISLQCINYT